MENLHQFSGENETEIWQKITADMQAQGEILEYSAQINQQDHVIYFDIDIDLGGGFEGGFETTTFMAPIKNNASLRFHLYPQNWLNEVGKILGLEDVELGYPELDEAFIIKANQPETLKTILSDETIRQILLKYKDSELKLHPEHPEPESNNLLTFSLDIALTEPQELREVYGIMLRILEELEG